MKNRKIQVLETGKVSCNIVEENITISNDNEVIINNKYSQISPGTELACIAGLEDWFKAPAVLGYTSIGEVMETGKNVHHVKKGDWVYSFGPHAEFFKIDINDRWHGICVKIPEGIKPEWASFTHMADIAITSLRVSDIQLGDYVMVTGAGPIGIMAAQLAQLQGANTIITDINPKRLELAKQCGIEHTLINIENTLSEEIKRITNGAGISCLIEASGMPQVINNSIKLIAQNGEMILLGTPRAEFNTNITPFLQHVHLWSHGSIKLKGALEFIFPTHTTEFNKHSKEKNAKTNLDLIHKQKLIVKPLHTHTFKPEEAEIAYTGLQHKKDEFIGVVFNWTKK